MKHLTKTVIDRAPTKPRAYILWDSELRGFGCGVHPSGPRNFIVQYRLRGSRKSYQPTIGEYGTLTPAQARKQATRSWPPPTSAPIRSPSLRSVLPRKPPQPSN
jgi:hypothetical protein